MGEGDLSPAILLLFFLPHLLVGCVFLVGVFLLTREARKLKMLGGAILALTLFGVFGLPVLNSLQQERKRDGFLADALLPDTVEMRDASVLVVGAGSTSCELICPRMMAEGFAARIVDAVVQNDEEARIYHAGPIDLTQLNGRLWTEDGLALETGAAGEDVDYILFTETHWLAYHHPESVLQFPEGAYGGLFLFRVEDARAFDIAETAPVLRIYQSPQMPPRFLWLTPSDGVVTVPSDEEIAEIVLSRLSR